MKTHHGVLTPEGTLSISPKGDCWVTHKSGMDIPRKRDNLSDLFAIGDKLGLTHLWVPEIDGMPEPDILFSAHSEPTKVVLNFAESGPYQGLLKSAHRWGSKDVSPLAIIFPEHTRWVECWDGLPTDKELLVTISYMEQALGVPMAGSPSTMGWKLLEKMHPDWVKNFPKVKLENAHFTAEAASDLVACFGKVKVGQYIHKVDRNSAYLSSSATEFYGVGDPVLDPDGSKYVEGSIKDGHRPGVWCCHAVPGDISLPHWSESGTYWLSHPIIRLMRKIGYEVEILHGWYFPECHQTMSKWSNFLWDSRMSFQTDKAKWRRDVPRELARQGIKMIAVSTVGLTAYTGFNENEESSKRRPDIRLQTVARTYELVYHNMMKFHELIGLMPVMVYTDALYYATECNQRDTFDPLLKRSDKLGGYKYEGYIEVTPEIAEVINSDIAVSEKLAVLNTKGWTK